MNRPISRLLLACLLCLFALSLATSSVARAQGDLNRAQGFFQRDRFLEEDIRRRLDANIPADQKVLLTYGGYIIPQWQEYTNSPGRGRDNYRQIDLRLWGQAVVDDVHRVYARMRMAWTNFGPGDSPFGWNQDLDGPNLDQGFYELQLTRALEKYAGTSLPADVRMTLGRQFIQFGNGLALSQVLDGGVVTAEAGPFRVTSLFAQTIHSQWNIDHSPSVEDHSDRVFGGIQIELLAIPNHTPFAYYVRQHDQTDERPVDFLQDYDYDSDYFGFGSTGEVTTDLLYNTEIVFETGTSQFQYPYGRNSRIRAFAFDQLFEYYFRGDYNPVLSCEYALATGDDDRDSATDTILGNRKGRDNSYLGFGYINTGYALAPEFTNLQFVRLGGRIIPLPHCELLERLEVGTNWFFYAKQKSGGPISDWQADEHHRTIGNAVDVYANWRVLSDLSVILRYGRFFAGPAYSDGDNLSYAYAGLVFSF